MMYPEEEVVPVALAILRVSEPDADSRDLTELDLDEARAALRFIYGRRTIKQKGW